MKIDQLRQMLELYKTKSINQAAANLFMSQPNLSQSIRNLEDELGCSLITRTNKGVSFTDKGKDFVQYSQDIINQFDHLQTIGKDSTDANTIHTLSISSMNYRTLILLAAEFYKQFPPESLRLILHEYDRDGVIDSVTNWDSEIGILNILSFYQKEVIKQLRSRNLRFVELSSDIPVVLVSENHPLYKLGDFATISPKDLAAYPLVRYSTMDYIHYGDKAHLVGITKHAGEIIVDTRSALHEILDNTDAFAVVSYNEKLYRHFSYYLKTHRLIIEGCTLTHKFGWIMREDASLSPLAKQFIQMLTAYLA